MTTIDDRIVGRIRKMLALANDKGATEGERDNALRMAHATLAKYNLDIAQISTGGQKRPEVEDRTQHRATFYGRPWARMVAQAVGELMFCKYLYITAHHAKDTVHLFIGSHANAVSASILAEFVVESITREGKRRQRENMAGNAYFRSFATGAAGIVARRCVRLREQATAAGGAPHGADGSDPATSPAPGTAIVLATVYERERDANEAFAAATMKITVHPPHDMLRRTNAQAMFEGARYGETVPLNKQVK